MFYSTHSIGTQPFYLLLPVVQETTREFSVIILATIIMAYSYRQRIKCDLKMIKIPALI